MPEGDTILWAATRMRPVLEGGVPDAIETPHPRFGKDRWPERLAGRLVERIETHGKNLFIVFGPTAVGDVTSERTPRNRDIEATQQSGSDMLVIHSHLRMTGSWQVRPIGGPWSRSLRRAWFIIRAGGKEVIQFDGPVLELMTLSRRRFDQRLAALGPDVLAPEFDRDGFLRRLRSTDPGRTLGDALLDQRVLAGIGNIWKAEGCWEAELDPWRELRTITNDDALRIIDLIRPRMLDSGLNGPPRIRARVYNHAGRPCPRCGTTITARGQGDANRTTFWCPGCQY
jgi:endonuclease-8